MEENKQTTNKQIISFYHLFVFIVVANVFIVYFICVCERSFLKSFAPFPADLLNKFNLIVLAKQGINSWQAIKSSIYFRPWLRFFLVIIILMTCVCWSVCRSWSYEIYCSHLRAMPLAGCNISHNADCLSNYLLTSCSLSLTTLQLMLECQRESVSGIVIMIIVNIESIHQYCKTLSIS